MKIPVVSNAGNLKIFNLEMPVDQVTFDLNPESFSISKAQMSNNRASTAKGKSTGVPSASPSPAGYVSLYRGSSPAVINFVALLTEENAGAEQALDATAIGGGVKARCDMLMQWVQPGGGSMLGKLISLAATALGSKTQIVARPPLLTLQWGDPTRGFLMQGTLTNLKVDYLRFDSIGNPTRAKVTAQFTEAPSSLLSLLTNPTSGGVPGRRAHMVRSGENLQSIATESYGHPQQWRAIAEANDIDDPFRVRPGRTVMLPPADDL